MVLPLRMIVLIVAAPTMGTGDTITGIIMMITIIMGDLMVDLTVHPGDEGTATNRRSVSDNVSKKRGSDPPLFLCLLDSMGFEADAGPSVLR